MKAITSKENPTYKEALKLLRRKYRDETGCYLLEGIKPVKDAIEAGTVPEKLFIREGLMGETSEATVTKDQAEAAVTIDQAEAGIAAGMISILDGGDEKTVCLGADLFDRLSDTENSQGVIALIRRTDIDPEGFLERAGKGNVLLLDRLQDPGNVGTVIRTAEAAGFTGIIALKGTVDIYSPKVARAAAGSLFRMPVITGLDEETGLDIVASGGWELAASTVDGGVDCFEQLPGGRICLAVGNEGAGISETIIDRAGIRLMIPMDGGIESLNAAVAAGILMYRIRNR